MSLNGAWSLRKAGDDQVIPAQVPGCVHLDLLANDMIPDPYYRDNESRLFWIGETDWTYTRTFEVAPDLLAHDRVLLRCHGLDTIATITINGQEIAQTDNMYRTYEFDVAAHLVGGMNEIAIHFAAPMVYQRQMEAEKGVLFAWSVGEHRISSGAWMRKEPCNFGWDWGPMLVTSGIWRDIELVAFDTARVADVLVLQDHHDGAVDLTVRVAAEHAAGADADASEDGVTATVVVTQGDTTVTESQPVRLGAGPVDVALTITDPQLWWPAGMGDQPLYTVTVDLRDGAQTVLDTVTKRIGLRTLTLDRQPDGWGESFQFVANGVPFFAKGANWIPADVFAPRLTPDDYERLIAASVAANMNMLRVWGGGLYEADEFYDLCDAYGVCVWQDFIFSCGTYPAYDADFMANVRVEAEDNVRRIRHHASLALWCGNNELEQGLVDDRWTATTMSWDDYGKLFDTLLPDVVRELDPQRDYWPGSPHSPCGDRDFWINPACGDTHLWGVWHGREPLEWYRSTEHRFISEFGLQSFAEPSTTATYTLPEDRNITSYVMEYHQRSGIGNSTIIHYMLDWFRLPTSFDALLWLSQILQGQAIKMAVEHWRRSMPRTMGALYWQLNDCWPAPSWSSIDSRGRWKALHYMARRFYAPVLVSGVEDTTQHTVDLHVTSDRDEALVGTLRWRLTTVQGDAVREGVLPVTLEPRQNIHVTTLELAAEVEAHTGRDLLLWLELDDEAGERLSDNLVLLTRPKHLALPDPAIRVDVAELGAGVFDVTLTATRPALFAWVDLPGHAAQFSDNFFDLLPGRPHTVQLTLPDDARGTLSRDDVRAGLRVASLVDTYRADAE